jgi:hypothetical protein
VAIVWIAAIVLTAGWLVTRAVLRDPPIEAGVHVAAPARPAAPVAHEDLVLPPPPAAAPAPDPAPAASSPEPTEAAPRPPAPRSRGVRKPAAPKQAAPVQPARNTDIVDPWVN